MADIKLTEKTVNTVIALLKEYTDKISNRSDFSPNFDQARVPSKFVLALEDLSQQASQLIENSGLEPQVKLELKLRLAEFEVKLQSFRNR